MSKEDKIFLWRDISYSQSMHMEFANTPEATWWYNVTSSLSMGMSACPVCGERLPSPRLSGTGGYSETLQQHYMTTFHYECLLCGWGYHRTLVNDWTENEHYSLSILREYPLNSAALPMDELGAYLRNNVSDLYALEPRRFEQLVEDVFRVHGYRTILTQATRDGGADIVIVQKGSSKKNIAIIECKKYKAEHRVGVSTVRMLVGAAVSWRVKRGYLVTTSDFSQPAKESVLDYKKVGFEIDLVALSDLVNLLGVYNKKAPALHLLTPKMRQEIMEVNKKAGLS